MTRARAFGTGLTIALILAAASPGRPSGAEAPQGAAAAAAPRLLVVIVADQFRGDYVRLYGASWTRGLHRLFAQGAVFPQAAYPYSYTVTCPGHASISTGTPPSAHGLIGNDWFDRTRGRALPCTDDPAATPVGLGGAEGTERHSLRWLRGATLADDVRRQSRGRRPARVATVSLKPRSAITLAGQPSPDTVAIWKQANGTWATSSAYARPPDAVDDYVRAHPIRAAYGQRWTRLLPLAAYLFADESPFEPAPRTLPHVLDSTAGEPDPSFVTRWERSPRSDEYTLEIALRLLDGLELGRSDAVDLLGVSFSALDLVGHRFGPRSHEVQDVLARLDVLLGRLFAALDRAVGAGRYAVAFSSDHGVAPLPEQAVADGANAGRLSTTAIRRTVEATLVTVLGIGTHVAGVSGGSVYLHQGVPARVLAIPDGRRRLDDALLGLDGVGRVYWAGELAATTPTRDPILAAARLSYVTARSGDIVVIPRPYWMLQSSGTTHGTPYLYDQQVPLAFLGAGVRPGRYPAAATPLDLAPTLARLAGLDMPRAAGRILTESLR